MNIRKSRKYVVPAMLLVTAILITFFLPRGKSFMYSYETGHPWMYETLNASFDFPILKTDDELRSERENANARYIPYFNFKNDVEADQLRRFTGLALGVGLDSTVRESFTAAFSTVYKRGILSEDRYRDLNKEVPIMVVENKHSTERLVSEVYTPYLAYEYIYSKVRPQGMGQDALYILYDRLNIADLLVPNVIFDEKTTQAVLQEKLQNISPTKGVVYSGQRIISRGEIVMANTAQILDSMKAEYNASVSDTGNKFLLILGQFMYMLVLLLILYIVIWLMKPDMLNHYSEIGFILLLLIVVSLGTASVASIEKSYIYYLPLPVMVLFVDAFFRSRFSLPVYWIYMMSLVLVTEEFGSFIISNMVAGTIMLYAFHFWNRGWQQFLSAGVACLSLIFAAFAENLISTGSMEHFDWNQLKAFVVASLLCIACYPLTFIFEKIFGFVSISRLRDLADTNSRLIRQLSEQAPGTLQHSMQVANLSDGAARAIGANHLLCRVGSLYHDIGKITNPQFFIENQTAGFNPHDSLQPRESALIITKHVDDGITLAKKAGIPQLVSDFIISHHGTTCTGYFYRQYLNNGGDSTNIRDFQYHGRLPRSKEEVIVSLADAVEAAARSLKDYSATSISNLVDKIVQSRFDEHQMDNAEISFKDINSVKESFKIHLQDIYHTRIAYPQTSDRTVLQSVLASEE